jgi:drug/metabolite transporter (DMT)-like permease
VKRRNEAILLVAGAGAAFATSGPLSREAAPLHPLVIAGGRVLLAALVLALIDLRGLFREVSALPARRLLSIFGAGMILAGHFGLFVWGLERTSLPAAVSLVSLEPLSVVVLAWLIHGIRPTRLEQLGVIVATAGAIVISRGAGTGEHRLFGDLLVLGAIVLYGLYISGARAFRGELKAGHYAALVYFAAALSTAMAIAVVPSVSRPITSHAVIAVIALALIPTVIGHTAVQAAARTTSPSIVALVAPAETVGALLIGAFFMGAWPSALEWSGAAVILSGVTIGILGAR